MEVPMPMTLSTKRFLITTAIVATVGSALAMPAAAQGAAKKGEEVYTAQKCQMCHAIAGKGNKANPLDGVGGKLSAADVKQWITNPTEAAAKAKSTKKPPMPNKYGSLPAADVDALVAYMQSLK
jgi:mono/diheme cytochrome c family protein